MVCLSYLSAAFSLRVCSLVRIFLEISDFQNCLFWLLMLLKYRGSRDEFRSVVVWIDRSQGDRMSLYRQNLCSGRLRANSKILRGSNYRDFL